MDYPVPKSRCNVRGFLGLANFLIQFIKQFSVAALPLTNLTKSVVEFSWTKIEQESFSKLKEAFTTAPIFMLPGHDKQFILDLMLQIMQLKLFYANKKGISHILLLIIQESWPLQRLITMFLTRNSYL